MANFTNNRWFTIISLLLVTANIVTLTLLWTNHKSRDQENKKMPPLQGEVFEFINNELKLDSSQRDKYRKLREEHRVVQSTIQDSLRKLKDDFFALLKQPGSSDSSILLAAKRVSGTVQQMELLTFRHFQKVRALCSVEQQQKFDDIIQEVLRRMAPRKNRQGPPPPHDGKEKEGPGRFPPPQGPENDRPE